MFENIDRFLCKKSKPYGQDFIHIWENTDQRKPVFWHFSHGGVLVKEF